jgi:hypothetical protein
MFISLDILDKIPSKMKNFLIILVLAFATFAKCLAVPMPVNTTLMKTFGTVDVDGVGPIHIVSYSTENLKVNQVRLDFQS